MRFFPKAIVFTTKPHINAICFFFEGKPALVLKPLSQWYFYDHFVFIKFELMLHSLVDGSYEHSFMFLRSLCAICRLMLFHFCKSSLPMISLRSYNNLWKWILIKIHLHCYKYLFIVATRVEVGSGICVCYRSLYSSDSRTFANKELVRESLAFGISYPGRASSIPMFLRDIFLPRTPSLSNAKVSLYLPISQRSPLYPRGHWHL